MRFIGHVLQFTENCLKASTISKAVSLKRRSKSEYLNFPDFLWYTDELEGAGDFTVFETVPLENYFEYYGNSLELFGI